MTRMDALTRGTAAQRPSVVTNTGETHWDNRSQGWETGRRQGVNRVRDTRGENSEGKKHAEGPNNKKVHKDLAKVLLLKMF